MLEIDRKLIVLRPHYWRTLVAFDGGEGLVKAVLIAVMAGAYYIFPTKGLQDTAIAAVILVVLDTVTGIAAAFCEKKPRSSRTFARVILKALAYLSVCAVAAIVEKTIFRGSGLSITMGVLWLIIATEGLSIVENVECIGGGRFRWLRALLGKVVDEDMDAARKEKTNV